MNLNLNNLVEGNLPLFVLAAIVWAVAALVNLQVITSIKGPAIIFNRFTATKHLNKKKKLIFYSSTILIVLLALPVMLLILYLTG